MTKTTKKPAVAIVQTRRDGTLPSGSGPQGGGPGDFRAIKEVIDTRQPLGHQRRTAQSVLDPLSAVGLAELRREVHAENAEGHSVFLCAQCETPVFLAQRPAAPDVTRSGEAAYFKHFSDPDAPHCPWRTEPNLHSVGAAQYNGQQEGVDHLNLKHALAQCLEADPRFTGVQLERRITGKDGSWRVPDVSAAFDGRTVAFDLQLATLQIATILERATFYAANNIHHVVLTDAVDLTRLNRQAFCDLHLNMGGRIFAIDDASIGASLRDRALTLQELRIVPRLVAGRNIHNVWQSRLVGVDTLLMAPHQRRRDGEREYSQALLDAANASFGPQRRAIRRAAAQNQGPAAIFEHWNSIARTICTLTEDSAIAQDVAHVLVFLAQVEVLNRAAPEQQAGAAQELQRRLAALLATRNALHWAPLVVQVLGAVPAIEPAIGEANGARLSSLLSQSEPVKPLLRWHGAMLSVLHPWLSFRLVTKAPKFPPSLRLPSSRA